jgi:N-acetylmuramoyl-L-alanine amidase
MNLRTRLKNSLEPVALHVAEKGPAPVADWIERRYRFERTKRVRRILAAGMILSLLVVLFTAVPAISADAVESKYLKIRDAYQEFLKKPYKVRRTRQAWMTHINAFSSIRKKYPKHKRADDALYWKAHAYRQMNEVSLIKSDLRLAVKAYQELIENYPSSNLADDAAIYIAEIYETKLNEKKKAYEVYARCCESFPKGDLTKHAVAGKARLAQYAPQVAPTPTPAPTPEPLPDLPPIYTPPPQVTPAPGSGPAVVEKIDVWSNPDYTRVAVYLDRPVTYLPNLLPADPDHAKPRRLYIDMVGSHLGKALAPAIPVGDGLLKQIRAGQNQPEVVRVVLDLGSVKDHRIFPMFNPYRVVIDVIGEAKPQPVTPKITRVVIDAGHGGKDPGAVAGGLREKNLALTIAKKAAAEIRKLGLEVVMTRNSDRFIPLEGRTGIANKKGADLFVSIHINAARRRSATGIETFHFSPRTNPEDLELVAAENLTAHKQVEAMDRILEGIELGYKKFEANALAAHVQREILGELTPYKGTVNRGVKSAPFYVLMGARMPAILVECGFITNKTDRKRLNYKRYQDRIAKGIAAGVKSYVRELDPKFATK